MHMYDRLFTGDHALYQYDTKSYRRGSCRHLGKSSSRLFVIDAQCYTLDDSIKLIRVDDTNTLGYSFD